MPIIGSADSETIRIGGLAPLTGNVAVYGVATQRGVDLYVEQINAAGGVLGKQVEMVWYAEKEMCIRDRGLTGASGSGKTTIIKAVMGILPYGCVIEAGEILLDGLSLEGLPARERREYCGTVLGFIPQSPMTAFDPHMRIGAQMVQTFHLRLNLSKDKALALAREQLLAVNLEDVERILNAFPSQLSGGMLKRVSMACLGGLAPVSYTHLDVYKRQALYQSGKSGGLLFGGGSLWTYDPQKHSCPKYWDWPDARVLRTTASCTNGARNHAGEKSGLCTGWNSVAPRGRRHSSPDGGLSATGWELSLIHI